MGPRTNVTLPVGIVAMLSAALVVACTDSGARSVNDDASTTTGGTSGSGGMPATGGASTSGGTRGSGGATNPGGGSATGGTPSGNGGNGGSGGNGGNGGNGGASGSSTSCATDPLRTGETPPDGDDEFDCAILDATKKYGEPDAMIFKAIIHTESRFAIDSIACPNLPCGTPTGWTAAESGCYGLMQIVPACVGPNKEGLLPSGHPNLTTDSTSPDWPGSIFNPSVNIDVGVYGVSDNRKQVKKQFPGCTEDQYTLMAIGNYNSYGSTKSCTVFNTAYDDEVLKTYRKYATEAAWPAHAY